MKKILLLITLTATIGLCGCGAKNEAKTVEPNTVEQADESKEDFIIEEVEETRDPDVSENVDNEQEPAEQDVEEDEAVLVVDESILDEPIPESLEETVTIMKAIPNGQLLSDFMFKVMRELKNVEYTDIEWTTELGAYIDSLATTNPTLLQEFYDAEVN